MRSLTDGSLYKIAHHCFATIKRGQNVVKELALGAARIDSADKFGPDHTERAISDRGRAHHWQQHALADATFIREVFWTLPACETVKSH